MPVHKLIIAMERATLLIVVGLTVGAIVFEVIAVFQRGDVVAADILLLLLYTEVLSMAGSYYNSRQIPVIYPLIIAITALARLIVLQGKDMDPQNILYEAVSILVISLSILVLRAVPVRRLIEQAVSKETNIDED